MAILDWFKNLFFGASEPFSDVGTFFVWEPCSKSHSEVVPGYAKYLLDLGYKVSVIVNPEKLKEGVFCRFSDPNLILNSISRSKAKKFFSKRGLSNAKGILVTTVGKLSNGRDYNGAYEFFAKKLPGQKTLFVEHEIKPAVDGGTWDENIITLRKPDYKGAKSVVVNPHYFGNVRITNKSEDIVKFIVVGALQDKRRDCSIILSAFEKLIDRGITNVKLIAVGKGAVNLPEKIKPYVELKGSLPFKDMYDEVEKADFFLTSYEPDFAPHLRYITTGTSGAFQLVYGFLKPVVIQEKFAPINGFNDKNSVIYSDSSSYSEALERCVKMSAGEYVKMQANLKALADEIYAQSLLALKELIEK